MTFNPQLARIGEILIHLGHATEAQVKEGLAKQKKSGWKLGQTLVKLGHVTERQLLDALHLQLDYTVVKEEELLGLDPEIVQLIPEPFAIQNRVIAIGMKGESVAVAMGDPENIIIHDNLKKILGKSIYPMLIAESTLTDILEKYYKRIRTSAQVEDAVSDFDFVAMDEDENEITIDARADAPVVKLVNLFIMEAIKSGATDIHIEPLSRETRVRFRIDGVLREIMSPPIALHGGIVSLIKVMSKLNIAERRLPQDGHISLKTNLKSIDVRVAITPTVTGEKVVMRLLDKGEFGFSLTTLGFTEDNLAAFRKWIHRPYGIIVASGPTGSGKSTTLHAALKEVMDIETNIVTVEDPVEYRLDGIAQIETNARIDLTFGRALRSVLRQDPDIILIGEIRDEETADIAIKFSLTGHLVFTTLHANDAPSTITRLLDIGVAPYLVASSLNLVMAQRLVRKICPQCITDCKPTPEELHDAGITPQEAGSIRFKTGAGCVHCDSTGYRGRTGIFEMLEVDSAIRALIFRGENQDRIRDLALRNGMKSLHESAVEKMKAGITSIREVVKLTVLD